jgi:hypothetical protein
MKAQFWFFSFLFFSVAIAPTAQAQERESPPYGFPPESRLESHQGQPDEPDVIGHRHIAKDVHLKCIQVEHHPKQGDDGAACLLRFEGADKYTLKFGDSMRAPREGEMYLECLGDKPTRCTVGMW